MGRWPVPGRCPRPGGEEGLEHRQGRFVGTGVVSRDLVVVVRKGLGHLAQLKDTPVDRCCGPRALVSVARLVTRRGRWYASRPRVTSTVRRARARPALADHLPGPAWPLRGPIALSGGFLMHAGHSILPDSSVAPIQPPPRGAGPPRGFPRRASPGGVEGTYYQMDNTFLPGTSVT